MKYFWIAVLLLSACANRAVNQDEVEAISQYEEVPSSGLKLLDAYQKTTTGGKEMANGKHTSTSYSMVFLKDDVVTIEAVYLYGEQKDFEAIDYEGKFFIIVQVYPEAENQEKGAMIQTSNAADVYYNEAGESKVLSVPKFLLKEAVVGK